MLVVRRGEVVHMERKVELIVAEVVGAVPVAQPGQLKQVRGLAVPKIDDDKAAVVRVDAAGFG